MAFIDKKDPVVLNIKLTSKGRELLSKGAFNFKFFTIGDSEIDYRFINDTGINPFNFKILRPVDKNPDIISFITRNLITTPLLNDEQYNEITNVPSITWNVENTIESIGFFSKNGSDFIFRVTSEYMKQPDAMFFANEATGGTELKLYKAPTYGANVNEPNINDYILVRWIDDESGFNTTGYTLNKNNPTPALFYKIIGKTGSLSSDNFVVTVDRELPDFNNQGSGAGSAMIFYSSIELNVEEEFSTDYASEALLSFLENCQCSTTIFPFWNLSIIYGENIAGTQLVSKQFGEYKTSVFGGFISYIQNHAPKLRKLGVIHYTNASPANVYAEQFLLKTPTIHIPTIMWHKSSGATLGVTLKAVGNVKTITGATSLNTKYYDLADPSGNVVGKVFSDLKLFTIEDQELLFAMSYKSNRSWTLPNYTVGTNDTIFIGCPECTIDFDYVVVSATTFGGTGSITITEIYNNIGELSLSKIILQISGQTSGVVFFAPITGVTTVGGLLADSYSIKILDLGSPECFAEEFTVVNQPAQQSPSVQTKVATAGIGQIVNTGGINIVRFDEVTSYGMYYKKSSDSLWETITTTGTLFVNNFTTTISGLDENTDYDYRAYITVDGIAYPGSILTIKTAMTVTAPPTLTTGTVVNLTTTGYTVQNNVVTDKGGLPALSYGIIWTTNPAHSTTLGWSGKTGDDTITGDIAINTPFTRNASGLPTDTDTWFRAYAQNANDYGYGVIKNQKTAEVPAITTTFNFTVQQFNTDSGDYVAGTVRLRDNSGIQPDIYIPVNTKSPNPTTYSFTNIPYGSYRLVFLGLALFNSSDNPYMLQTFSWAWTEVINGSFANDNLFEGFSTAPYYVGATPKTLFLRIIKNVPLSTVLTFLPNTQTLSQKTGCVRVNPALSNAHHGVTVPFCGSISKDGDGSAVIQICCNGTTICTFNQSSPSPISGNFKMYQNDYINYNIGAIAFNPGDFASATLSILVPGAPPTGFGGVTPSIGSTCNTVFVEKTGISRDGDDGTIGQDRLPERF